MKAASFTFAILASFGCFAQAPKDVEVITLSNACYDCEFTIPKDKSVILKPVAGTTNRFCRITGKRNSQLTIDGKGTVVVEGGDTLIKVPSLKINDCALVLKSTGASEDKLKVVEVKNDLALECASLDCVMPASIKAEVRVIQANRIRLQNSRAKVNASSAGSEIFSADDSIMIGGGEMQLVADDDCFSAMNNITVNGGYIHATSLSDDVFDSNGDIVINDGTILAFSTAKGHEGFDVDPMKTESGNRPHQLTVNGGTIIATGGKKSDWPSQIIAAPGLKVSARTKLDSSAYSEKPLSILPNAGLISIKASFPRFPDDKCSILVISSR